MELRVGMMVRVVGPIKEKWKHDVGKVGTIDSMYINPGNGVPLYTLDCDTDVHPTGLKYGYRGAALQPINPDNETNDITFEALMDDMNRVPVNG